MPRYYFHFRDVDGLVRDDEGESFEDIETATSEARLCARDLAIDHIRRGLSLDGRTIDLTNGEGDTLISVPLSFVIVG